MATKIFKPDNFERAMAMLRRHSYDDVAEYCEALDGDD